MNLKYLMNGLLVMAMTFVGCQDPDDLVRTDNEMLNRLSIKGVLTDYPQEEYPTEIDMDNGTVKVIVPYYISDTERIQGDLTKMKLSAELPTGAMFSPALTGVHNLEEGFSSTLLYEDGRKQPLVFTAEYLKSDKCMLAKVELTKTQATIRIVQPQVESEKGKVLIFTTNASMDRDLLKDAKVQFSPWANIESDIYNPVAKTIDLSQLPTFSVVAQNGIDKITYETAFQFPEKLPYGVGYSYPLFGFQVYKEEPLGFEMDANKTMAVVGNYLIVSNSKDFNQMPVFNRFSGEKLNVRVNCEGIDPTRSIRAITTDDAGHLVAMSFTSTKAQSGWYEITDKTVFVWAWKNGIENAPVQIMAEEWDGSTFSGAPMSPGAQMFIGTAISVSGDITSGKAILTACVPYGWTFVYLGFENGKLMGPAKKGSTPHGYGDPAKIIPLSTDFNAPLSFVAASGNENNLVSYAGTDGKAFAFTQPQSHYWPTTNPGAFQGGSTKGIDYIEFNGAHLVAVQNDNSFWSNGRTRLFVTDITANPQASSLMEGFIFDSLEGNALGDATVPGGMLGTGWGLTGIQLPDASFAAGKSVFGSNNYCTGDVVFAKSEDGNAVQVYMMTTNTGIFGYELTNFKLD